METAENLRAFTQDLYLRLSFPAPAAALLQQELEKLLTPANFPAFYAILDQYQDGDGKYPNMEMLLQMQALCHETQIPDFTGALLLLSCMCLRLKERYQRNGMPEELFYHTMSDLRYKLTECMEVYGLVGNFVPWWYYGFLTVPVWRWGGCLDPLITPRLPQGNTKIALWSWDLLTRYTHEAV